jgi:hypothetical protein
MLHEAAHEREPNRRWFSDEDFDLIVWFADAVTIAAIQLCYDKSGAERAVTWSAGRGYGHFRVELGEESPFRNQTPIFVTDGPFHRERILPAFAQAAAGLDPAIRCFVLTRLREFPASLASAS